jgi:hypothetical protein
MLYRFLFDFKNQVQKKTTVFAFWNGLDKQGEVFTNPK